MANSTSPLTRSLPSLSAVDTPALLIHLDVLDRNLRRLADFARSQGIALRPHFKAHRMEAICRRQMELGAIGITCAKLAEAEALADHGYTNLLVANQVVGPAKWERLARLAQRCHVMVAVDSYEAAAATSEAAERHGSRVGVLVEVNVGMDRCGVAPGQPTVDLARRCLDLPGLRFEGVMGYEGHAVPLPRAEKEVAVRECMERLVESAEACRAAGLEVPIVSGGGTGTWDITGTVPGITELQCGTYALMDLLFAEVAGAPFEWACTVLSTVISRPTPERAVVDSGRKSIHPSFGPARVADVPGARDVTLNSEHGILQLDGEAQRLRVGDRIQIIPSYLEGTTNLFHQAYAVRGEEIVEVWEVTGQGRSQ